MITPSFNLTATERVLPKLALDFTTATLDPRITFTRTGNTATVTNSLGALTAINANLPRFDYDPTTLICKGLLIEEARANILLNSLLDGTPLSTQSVTTAAVAYTLSFYGTGEIVLSGTSSSTVVGTGVYPSRRVLTFTPTAGTLTLTVTGSVQYAQLEAGAFATSFIPTAGASVTRNADITSMTGTNFSSWYNTSEGTFQTICSLNTVASNFAWIFSANFITNNSFINMNKNGLTSDIVTQVFDAGVSQASLANLTTTAGATFNAAMSYKTNAFSATANAGTVNTDNLGTISASTNKLDIGQRNSALFLNGYIAKLNYWNLKITDSELKAFSK
jgi:hypothetical protein